MKKLRKGNALLFTVIILFAISTIASGLTMYFYRANLLANNTNTYFEKHLELSNEMSNTYKIILDGSNNNDGDNLKMKIATIANFDGGYYSYSSSKYQHIFTHVESSGEVKKCKYTIENTVKSKVYTLERILLLNNDGTYAFDSGEVYYVHANN